MIRNPILPGFNPDPSICRVGRDYYIATSTFEWYPGVQIHHSTDLANWTLVRRPLDRASQGKSLRTDFLSDRNVENIRKLNDIAQRRGQTLAQMALAWVLRRGRVTSALIGASRPEQVEDCVGALKNRDFSDAELAEIDQYAREADINLWAASAERKGPARKK